MGRADYDRVPVAELPQAAVAEASTDDSPQARLVTAEDVSVESQLADDVFSEHPGTSKSQGVAFNMANNILGAGIIGLPFAMAEAGPVPCILLLAVLALCTDYVINLLIRSGVFAHARSYEELGERSLGKPGYFLVCLFITLMTFGALCAFVVIIGDTAPVLAQRILGANAILADRQLSVPILCSLVVLPLSLPRDISMLSSSSLVSLIAVSFISFVVIVRGASTQSPTDLLPDASASLFGPALFPAIGTISLAYIVQHNAFRYFLSLERGVPLSNGRFERVTHVSVGIACFLCTGVAIMGYRAFGKNVKSNVLRSLDDDDDLANIARFCLCINMLMTYPLEIFACRATLISMIEGFGFQWTRNTDLHVPLTFLIWSCTVMIGTFASNVGSILELSGSFSAVFVGFLLPAMFALRLYGRWKSHAHSVQTAPVDSTAITLSDSEDEDVAAESLGVAAVPLRDRSQTKHAPPFQLIPVPNKRLLYVLVAFGALSMVTGTGMTLKNIISGEQRGA